MPSFIPSLLSTAAVCLAATFLFLRRSYDNSLPPGPIGLPFLGNVLDLTRDAPWKTYKRWGEQYGSLFTFRIIGRAVLVINSLQDCRELLEKRSHIYSDRPHIEMLSKMGWDFNLVFIPYHDKRFPKYRRAVVRGIGSASNPSTRPIVSERCNVLLLQLFEAPSSFETHLRDYTGSVLLQRLFGFTDYRRHRSFIHNTVMPAVEGASGLSFFGAQILFAFPWLGNLPSWVPGIKFLKDARDQLLLVERIMQEPVDEVKTQMQAQTSSSTAQSWARDLLQSAERGDDPNALSEREIREVTSTAITGGIDTTTSALKTMILAMLTYPDVQKRAQEEIDAVTGYDRLPDFSDLSQLPYVIAMCKEVLRWSPPLPVASHNTSSADQFQGHVIPKDTTVAVNLWAMSRDSTFFKDPEKFLPDRYLEENEDLSLSWGLGRRSCPGRNLAESMLYLAAARILAVYDIRKQRAPDGKELVVNPEFVSQGILLQPKSFRCSFVTRSKDAKALVEKLIEARGDVF
ncbi:hypothetical protein VNI00_007087 [Paramarasmius palmivorus]|uniref:Cytochrome P450 n=1 Tax=Paramarasmius palmivorus TaxID=297713 RepID=A0AAW0D0S0_9AGAR